MDEVLISVEDCVLIEKNCLYEYVSNSREQVLKEVKAEGILNTGKLKLVSREEE